MRLTLGAVTKKIFVNQKTKYCKLASPLAPVQPKILIIATLAVRQLVVVKPVAGAKVCTTAHDARQAHLVVDTLIRPDALFSVVNRLPAFEALFQGCVPEPERPLVGLLCRHRRGDWFNNGGRGC